MSNTDNNFLITKNDEQWWNEYLDYLKEGREIDFQNNHDSQSDLVNADETFLTWNDNGDEVLFQLPVQPYTEEDLIDLV